MLDFDRLRRPGAFGTSHSRCAFEVEARASSLFRTSEAVCDWFESSSSAYSKPSRASAR